MWLYQPHTRGSECDGSTVTGSILQYPWGTAASGFPDPDAVLSGTNQNRRPGDEGVCNPLLSVARGGTGETRATRETGATGKTEEMTAAREMAAAPEATTVTTPGAVIRGETLRDVERTVQTPACPADTELRPTTADFPPLQQPKGQGAENPENLPLSGEIVALPDPICKRETEEDDQRVNPRGREAKHKKL
ncbi:hypothetical protein NDU88_005137 [Pleurodeles waltl]|uniref:Uncharacterized protein n=1 Tax=Pleurodeles waltl TaxID=8319 RepID=A0AAV7TAH1_PLEWA|nr:hypothetical protein NDU88_005137 [Pleurodeles waltl]